MVAATAQEFCPKYFPDSLDLPLSPDHKTWHTERLCPPLLAQALGERQALFIAQLHYWLQKDDVGVFKHGWHWIYNAEWEWLEQFPWLSEHTIGRIRRALERRGYVVSNDFNRNPFTRTKHSTLDYYLIAIETGWNPLGLDLNRSYPHPPVFTKGVRQRGRHLSDSTPLIYESIDSDEPESLKTAEIVDSANLQNASCTSVTIHSALMPVSSIYKEIPKTSKSNLETDLKNEDSEGSQRVRGSQKLEIEKAPSIANEQKEVNLQIIEFSGEGQVGAAAPSLINHEEIKPHQQFLASLNASVEQANSERTRVFDVTRPIRISGLDEEFHYILWKYQAQLEKLNADLHAERIQKAIADNPHHLEDAILAFIENSASGAKTQDAATGFLFNALRQGWKPRQSHSSASAFVPVYTPHPLMRELPKPTPLLELVQRKRHLWQVALIMRPTIKVWAEQTEGVVIGPDGPELAREGALTLSPTEPAPDAPEMPLTSPEATTFSAAAPIPSDPEAKAPTLTSDSLAEAQKEAKASTLAASLTSQPVPADPPVASVPSPKDEPLKVGERVLWENCPVHCASWNPFTISNIIGGQAWLDVYEKPVPLSELKRSP